MSRLRIAIPVLLVASLATVTLLSGCAGESAEANDGPTLSQTKSPAQLLRNEAASRLPVGQVQKLGQTADLATACSVDDPTMLAWQSSADMVLNSQGAKNGEKIFTSLVKSFTDEGWDATKWDPKASALVTELTSATSVVTVEIKSQLDADGDGKNATVRINVTGDCVHTDGPDSLEVRKLENISE